MPTGLEPDAYCREVESLLCRKNDGHLIRLVGPAFELVRGWATSGVPLSIVRRGVEQYFDRYYAKGPRRRPVRIEFCEGDILDLFGHWRRATGISLADAAAGGPDAAPAPVARQSLSAHLDRLITRLDECLARIDGFPAVTEVLTRLRAEVAGGRQQSKGLRGDARGAMLRRLQQVDSELLAVARATVPTDRRDALVRVAEAELEPFRDRMTAAAFGRAIETATDRLIRDELGLPTLPLHGC